MALGVFKQKWCDFFWRSHGCRWGNRCTHAHSIHDFNGPRDDAWLLYLQEQELRLRAAAEHWARAAQNQAARAPEFADEQKCMAGHLMVEGHAIINGTCDECNAIIGRGAQVFACTACSPTWWRCSGCQKAWRRWWQPWRWDNQSVAQPGRDPAPADSEPAPQAEITDYELDKYLQTTLNDDLHASVYEEPRFLSESPPPRFLSESPPPADVPLLAAPAELFPPPSAAPALASAQVTVEEEEGDQPRGGEEEEEEEDQPRGGEEEQEEPRFLSENPPPLDLSLIHI